ncbi:hypothetical protein NIES23_33060 [Trichormus variabilis NIES-23]|uniref:Uncharacterized protein n=1 Tax=Trichormus variabilis NIES-23 TaxID=1973479 RepID=A0A1Z4KNH9_ANAVA|nr:hypothetical protein NIES23_33060 [Trichormus variabilis NIES-23]
MLNAVFVTGIYASIQKLFALKCEVLDPIVSITISREILSNQTKLTGIN